MSISKFIINRNNLEFLYTEKVESFDGIQFIVYESTYPVVYYPDSFYQTFGSDPKLSIARAIDQVEINLLSEINSSKEAVYIYTNLKNVKQKLINKKYNNPNLGKERQNLINAIALYNKMELNNYEETEHDYLDDCLKLESYYSQEEKQKEIENPFINKRIINEINLTSESLSNGKDARVRIIEQKQEVA